MINFFKCVLLLVLTFYNYPEGEEYISLQEKQPGSQSETGYTKEEKFKVIGVKDGDTIDLLMDGKKQTVRLAHIDAPEKNQPFGTKAKQFLSGRCFGNYVRLIHNNKYDRNRRLIAEVITTEGINLNKELVRNGLAWHYKKYSSNQTYHSLETQARNLKSGLWSEPNPTAPWNWRK